METEFEEGRGILFRDTSLGDGIVNVDGNQHSFSIAQWKTYQPPRVGMTVDVILDRAGQIVSLREVPDTQMAREQAEQMATAAKRQGDALAGGIRKHFGITVFVVELALLVSFFFLPSLSIAYTGRSLTAWDVLGLDLASFSTNDHGLLSLLALALFGPLVAPFLRKAWARWLYGAPLGFVLLVLAEVFWQINQAGAAVRNATGGLVPESMAGEMSRQAVGMLHVNLGAFLVFGCSIYLATRIFRPNK